VPEDVAHGQHDRSGGAADPVRRLDAMTADLILGVGCVSGVAPEALARLLDRLLAAAGVGPQAVAGIATLDRRGTEPGILLLAARLGVPLHLFPVDRLEAERPRLAHPSPALFARIGCHGVAEGAALAAAGPAARLIVPRLKGEGATGALAGPFLPVTKD